MNTDISFEFVPVWKNVDSALSAELVDLWGRTGAIADPAKAAQRAAQAVSIVRDANGKVCGVGTAVLCIFPRVRQPLYYYRLYFAPEFRGQRQTVPFFIHCRKVLEAHNAALPAAESLGVLIALESSQLAARYTLAREPGGGSIFIGYTPQGLQMRAYYFDNARLFPPATMPPEARSGAAQ